MQRAESSKVKTGISNWTQERNEKINGLLGWNYSK